jgi:hypothetical protein
MTKTGPTVGNLTIKPTASAGLVLLPGEHLVTQSHDRLVTVTSHRVLYHTGFSSNSRYTSITLDAVSSCGLTTTSQPLLFVLGILAIIGGLAMINEKGVGPVGLVVGLFLIVLYFVTHSAALLICSNGGERITLPAPGSQRAALLALLSAVDEAKIAAADRGLGVAAGMANRR